MKVQIGIGLFVAFLLVTLSAPAADAQQRGGQLSRPGVLTPAETTWILRLRQEEKLARDVYLTLAKRWSVPIFSNIAQSEQKHMDAVKTLIATYRLADPVVDDTVGVFTNPEFADLYQSLVLIGSDSVMDAYEVGVTIEEMDIADLTAAQEEVNNRDILRVFQNLLAGSQNHLEAFLSRL